MDRPQVEDFEEAYGEPDVKKEHGHQMVLYYEKFPEVENIAGGEGGYYTVQFSCRGGSRALQLLADVDYNGSIT